MGPAPKHQASNVHHTPSISVIRREEALRPLSLHAYSLAPQRYEARGATRHQTNYATVKSIPEMKKALS